MKYIFDPSIQVLYVKKFQSIGRPAETLANCHSQPLGNRLVVRWFGGSVAQWFGGCLSFQSSVAQLDSWQAGKLVGW